MNHLARQGIDIDLSILSALIRWWPSMTVPPSACNHF